MTTFNFEPLTFNYCRLRLIIPIIMVILVIIVIRTIRVLRRDRVHNNSTQRRLDVLQGQESAIEGTLIGTAGFDDHDDTVDFFRNHGGIGDGYEGRGVEEDHVPFLFDAINIRRSYYSGM